MGQLIIHKDGAFNVFDTVSDGPVFVSAITEAQLTDWIMQQSGLNGLRNLPPRIARAVSTGCSAVFGTTLTGCIMTNRAGENEKRLSAEEFIRRYLTLPAKDPTP